MTISNSRLALIGAQSTKWPALDTLQWEKLRETIDAIRNIVRVADADITAVEQNADLSDAGRLRRMSERALKAIDQLETLPVLAEAKRYVEQFLTRLDEKRGDIPKPPSGVWEVSLQAEIRFHMAAKPDPLLWAMNNRTDPRVVAAVTNAPAFLSGLTDEQFNIFLAQAATALWPDDEATRTQNLNAVEVAETAVGEAIRIIADRGQLMKTANGYQAPSLAA